MDPHAEEAREKVREGGSSKERRENKRLRDTWDGEGQLQNACVCVCEQKPNNGVDAITQTGKRE